MTLQRFTIIKEKRRNECVNTVKAGIIYFDLIDYIRKRKKYLLLLFLSVTSIKSFGQIFVSLKKY